MTEETSTGFYRFFEDKHRGSRDLIRGRLRVYLPFVQPLKELYGVAKAIDLGCGRGEWLELLQESGFEAQGVDLDEGMLVTCRELGFKVEKLDAIEFLKTLPDASQALISGIHIAEHIRFTELQTMIQEAYRVLQPGGLLILETPNPENIVVATASFYLDPTHERPIPLPLLTSITEYCGFERVKGLRLQEARELAENQAPSLFDVLDGVSPDYAVVAQKWAEPAQMKLFDAEFDRSYGLTLEVLARRYEARNEARLIHYEARLIHYEEKLSHYEERLSHYEACLTNYQERLFRAERAEATLEKLRNTKLWRALRWGHRRINSFKKR